MPIDERARGVSRESGPLLEPDAMILDHRARETVHVKGP